MKQFSSMQITKHKKKENEPKNIYVTIQVLHGPMLLFNFCMAKKKDIPTAEFFSEVSKRQRNPVENFKTQSVGGGEPYTVKSREHLT